MSVAAPPANLLEVQRLTLSGVTWEFYEHLLEMIENGGKRVTFDDGEIEIMSPLPKHEMWGGRIRRLAELIGEERGFAVESLGSTTFRTKAKKKGLEPDECFYVRHADAPNKMEGAWSPALYPPPDVAVEIDVTRRSIAREPIYAALNVPELWRFDGRRFTVLLLNATGAYGESDRSATFPFVPMDKFAEFVVRFSTDPQLAVIAEFRKWVRAL